MKSINKLFPLVLLAFMVATSACNKDRSSTTGWNYNDPKNGGFENTPYTEQETGPRLSTCSRWYIYHGSHRTRNKNGLG